MKRINKTASTVLSVITAGLDIGEGRKIDLTDGAFMPVYVNRLDERHYSVAHYYKQNGDMVPDPDMEFIYIDATESWLPVHFQMAHMFQRALVLDGSGSFKGFYPQALNEQIRFAGTWMCNIKEQQGGLRALRKACAPAVKAAA